MHLCALVLCHPLTAPAAQCCPCKAAEMTEASVAIELQVCLQESLFYLLFWLLHTSPDPITGVSSVSLLTPQPGHCFCGIHSSVIELLWSKVLRWERSATQQTRNPWNHL